MNPELPLIAAAALAFGIAPAVPRLVNVLRPSGRRRAGDPLPAPYAGFHAEPLTVVTPLGVFATGFRWCPECLRQETAIVHADGSAHCDRCGTHIPAGDDQ